MLWYIGTVFMWLWLKETVNIINISPRFLYSAQNKYCMIKSRQYLWWRQWPHTTHNDTKHSNLTSIILLSLVTIHNLFSQPLLSDTTRAHQDQSVTTVGSKQGLGKTIICSDFQDFNCGLRGFLQPPVICIELSVVGSIIFSRLEIFFHA